MTSLLSALRYPIIAAPMAGGPSTPELVSAVSGVGGLGFLGAGYLTVERLAQDLAATRALTTQPFGVNVFLPGSRMVDDDAVWAYRHRMLPEAARYGVSPGEPVGGDDAYAGKMALLLREPVPVVSFSFGLPDAAAVRALRARGSEVWATVTHPRFAESARDLGVDAIVVQGAEAGAHRGGTDDTDDYGLLALLRLVAHRVDTPLVGCGGVADGPGVAAVLAAGAAAVALGTAFLRCPEAGTAPMHRAAILGTADTALTRAFTGRLARGVVNRFMREHEAAAPAAYPHIHQVTQPIRVAARAAGDAQAVHLWAGQAHSLALDVPAGDLVARLAADAAGALAAAAHRLSH